MNMYPLLQAIGGLVVAATIKYADNILKGYIKYCSTFSLGFKWLTKIG